MLEQSEALHARVQAFIRDARAGATGATPESFDALALDIAHFQARAVEPVGRLWRARGLSQPTTVDAIPAVPCDAFRLRRIAAHPAEQDRRCFATSGTTADARGLHPMRTTATYVQAALAWGAHLLWPDVPAGRSMPMVVLASPETLAPTSSLTFMLARFAEALGGDVSWHFDGHRVDIDAVVTRIRALSQPTLVAGTSFAFVHLLDTLRNDRLPLPQGSRIMQTGGFKGRSREVQPNELCDLLATCFAVPSSHVVGEYGMTELSSQLYQAGLRRENPSSPSDAYHPPPWLRITAVDPDTLAPLPPEAVGLARIVDLANVDSSVAIQTADRIRCHDDRAISLLGRAPGATPRGCSLALEHLVRERDAP